MHDESWCISKANNCKSWLTNHRRFNFTTRNVLVIMHASLRAFRMVTPNFRVPPKVFIILLNRPSQLIRQYFPRQLVQVSLFANILPLQNFSMYGIYRTIQNFGRKFWQNGSYQNLVDNILANAHANYYS